MATAKTILFVNPWAGIIGPNVGLEQMVNVALGRGNRVHIAAPRLDDILAGLQDRGATCHMVAKLELTPRPNRPIELARHLLRSWRVCRQLAGLARRAGAGVICVNGENMLLAPRAGRLAGAPVAVMIRGLRFGELGLAGRLFFGLQQRWVARYVATTQIGAEVLVRQGVPAQKVAVIPNSVDLQLYRPLPPDAALAGQIGLSPGDEVIGTVTHLTPRKGALHLVECVALLVRERPGLKCLIIGDARTPEDHRYAQSLRRRIDELGLRDNVLLLGQRRDVPALLALMEVFVLPSETEAFSRAAIEAQACERPVVAFRVGGVPEVVQHQHSGLLVEPLDAAAMAQAVSLLLKDPDRRRQMGKAGRTLVHDRFNIEMNVKATIELLEGLAGQP